MGKLIETPVIGAEAKSGKFPPTHPGKMNGGGVGLPERTASKNAVDEKDYSTFEGVDKGKG